MIVFPGDQYRQNTETTFVGGYGPMGGAERFAQIDASIINVTNLNASNISAGTISADRIGANSITAGKLNVSTLSSITADVGTLTAGTINGVTISLPNESLGTGNAGKLIWASNARIWGDSSGFLGFNAVGGTGIFYSGGSEVMQFNASGGVGNGGVNITGLLNCKELFLSQGQVEGSIRKVDIVNGYNDLRFATGDGGTNDDYKFLRDDNSGNAVRIEHDTGYIHSFNDTIDLATNTLQLTGGSGFKVNGTAKSAIVPVEDGFVALYSAEAPEVWFFDFCDTKESIDPLFLEVTEGDMKFIAIDGGGFQVWRRRKGHANKRFEAKSAQQFEKNERFLNIPK